MHGYDKCYAEHHNWMQNVTSYHAHNILSKFAIQYNTYSIQHVREHNKQYSMSLVLINTTHNSADKRYAQQPTNR